MPATEELMARAANARRGTALQSPSKKVSTTGLRPPTTKYRAQSAPSVPKNHASPGARCLEEQEEDGTGSDTDNATPALSGETGDDEIARDEFFQRYHFPQPSSSSSPGHAKKKRGNSMVPGDAESESAQSSSDDTEGPPISPTAVRTKARMSGTGEPPRSPAASIVSGVGDPAVAMQDINVAVLGNHGAGKSTFIRRALNIPETGSSSVCTRPMTIDGGYYLVRFVEIPFDHIHIGNSNAIRWPDTVDGLPTPRIDGAVTLYDVTSKASLKLVPEMLRQSNTTTAE